MEGFCPLASGSKGNAIYFGTAKTKILIDCGISGKVIEERLGELGVELHEIQAIVISHEHTDHIGGLKFALKHNIPILANSDTAKGIYATLRQMPRFKIFTTDEPFIFGDIEITPFSIQHDTLDPVAFTLRINGIKVGICTDIGFVTPLVTRALMNSDFLYLEANHEPSMVLASSRPQVYKDRVLSRSGHLSNEACADLLANLIHPKLRHIYLAHLSQECNNPETARRKVVDKIGNLIPIAIAPQERMGEALAFV